MNKDMIDLGNHIAYLRQKYREQRKNDTNRIKKDFEARLNAAMLTVMDAASREIGDNVSKSVIANLQGAMSGKPCTSGKSSFSINLGAMLGHELGALPFDVLREMMDTDRD